MPEVRCATCWPPPAPGSTTSTYDPYGNATAATGASHASWTDFRYAGLVFHPTSGLYLATHRIYDPATGRWLSRDQIGEQGGINLYQYVGDNPLSGTDPLGLQAVQIGINIRGGSGMASGNYETGIAVDIHGNVKSADNINQLPREGIALGVIGGEGVAGGIAYSSPTAGARRLAVSILASVLTLQGPQAPRTSVSNNCCRRLAQSHA